MVKPKPDSPEAIEADLEKAGAVRRRVTGASVEMMLAEIREQAFRSPDWVFELKLDGYRLLVERDRTRAHVISRNGHELAGSFPEIAGAVLDFPFEHLVLDGEVVAMDDNGRPSFQRLQQRGKLTKSPDVARAAGKYPIIFFAFDLLALGGFDLRGLPLLLRKAFLARVVTGQGPIRYLDYFPEDGENLFRNVVGMGLEGIVGKRAESVYKGGRSPHWLKIRADRTDDFVVVGFTQPKGARHGFGALLVGQYVAGKLVYAGRAGTGFNSKQLTQVRTRLDALTRKTPPCEGPVPAGESTGTIPLKSVPDYRTSTWVEPELVCELRFKEWTDEGYLRQPAFLRFRDDKDPEDCVRQLPPAMELSVGSNPTASLLASGGRPARKKTPVRKAVKSPGIKPALKLIKPDRIDAPSRVPFTNLGKVLWPEDGYTKGDLIDYYRAISPWLLPYLDERPVVLTRFPDGIQGKSFFQKDAPGYAPPWLRTERMWSEHAERDIDYFICDDVESLLYLANMAAIPLHVWASRAATLTTPDWCSLDLDPKGAPFAHVIEVAHAARDLCQRISLPAYIKTTGSSGLHVMIPLGRQCTHDQARALAEVLAQALVQQLPKIATVTRAVQKREGKVYVDYLQNGHGKLLVAPFSVRPLPGAPVSMPLDWDQVNGDLDIRAITIRNAVDRMKKMGHDPLANIINEVPDLSPVLEALHAEF
jgi:bifunctional non-homologous end joining protein LigD